MKKPAALSAKATSLSPEDSEYCMMLFAVSKKHHAVAAYGVPFAPDDIVTQWVKGGLLGAHSPDVFLFDIVQWGIAESRLLRSVAQRKPMQDDGTLFILIRFATIGSEAQDALLKTLEEPAVTTCIIVCAPYESALQNTIRSRVFAFAYDKKVEKANITSPETEATLLEQLSAAAAIAQKKDIEAARVMLGALARSRSDRANALVAGKIAMAADYANERSPSIKMLLEYSVLIQKIR